MQPIFKFTLILALTVSVGAPHVIPGDFRLDARALTPQAGGEFCDNGSGLSFYYPRAWAVERNPENECIVKVAGLADGGYQGEVKLNVSNDALAPEKMAAIVETAYFKDLPNYKKIAGGPQRFGRLGQFQGQMFDISFKMGDLPVRQQYLIFAHHDKTYTLACTAPAAGFAALQPAFKQVLGTITANKAQRTVASNAPTRAATRDEWKLIAMENSPIPVRLWYPEGWRLSNEGSGDERGFKIVGKNAAGHDAELHLWSTPRGELSVEQLAEMLEQEHLKPLPHYKKVMAGHKSFGTPPVEGIDQFSTFVGDGLPGKQHAFFFGDRERFYCLGLMSVAWTQDEMRSLFDRVASSIKIAP